MSDFELSCDLCAAPSKLFCFCKSVKTKLCKSCEPLHYKKQPKAKHQTFTIGAFLFLEQPQDFEDYLERSRNVKQVTGLIENAELRLGEECERVSLELESEEARVLQLVKEAMENARSELTELHATTVSTLRLLKSKVASTLRFRMLNRNDVVHRLVQEPSTALPFLNSFNLFVRFQSDSLATLLDKYCECVATSDVQNTLPADNHLFWSDADGVQRLFTINPGLHSVGIFNPERHTTCHHILKPDISLYEYSSWCLAESSQLAVCGGYNEQYRLHRKGRCTRSALLIDPLTTEVRKLPQMLQPRRRGGLLYRSGQLFMFGGYKSDYLRQVEKFDFSKMVWMEVGFMNEARSAVSPVEHNRKVLLVGDGSHEIELYCIDSSKFETLKTQLPFDSWATAFVVEGQFLILQRSRLVTLAPRDSASHTSHFSKHEVELEVDNWWYSQSAPVYCRGKCYFLRYCEVWALDPQSCELVKVSGS